MNRWGHIDWVRFILIFAIRCLFVGILEVIGHVGYGGRCTEVGSFVIIILGLGWTACCLAKSSKKTAMTPTSLSSATHSEWCEFALRRRLALGSIFLVAIKWTISGGLRLPGGLKSHLLLPLQRTLERRNLALSVDKPLLKSFNLIVGMVGRKNGSQGGGIRRGIEETELVSGEKSGRIVLFPVPGRSNSVCGTEWIVFVITRGIGTGMGAIRSEWRSEFGQATSIALHLYFQSI
jgi:hypothetical protein